VKARAAIVAEPGCVAGGTMLSTLRSEAPLVLRRTASGVHLVAGAAGPMGGDQLALDVEVAAGASLTVRSVAASVALPGPDGAPSDLRVTVRVAAGGVLRWLPEPLVAAAHCRHRARVDIEAEAGAAVVWREELVAGRHGEPGGSATSRLSVQVAGRPLLRHEIRLGPGYAGWDGPAVVGAARAVGSILVMGHSAAEARDRAARLLVDHLGSGRGVVLPLAGPGIQVVAVAPGARALRAVLDEGLAMLRAP
jgi:urease accessory protein